MDECDLYSKLFAMLGKSTNAEICQQTISALGPPNMFYNVGPFEMRHYFDLGVSFDYSTSFDRICGLTFHLNTFAVRTGDMKSFKGNIIRGITMGDTPTIVDGKLGLKPFFVSDPEEKIPSCANNRCDDENDHWVKYNDPPYQYTFIFDSHEGALSLASISLPECYRRSPA